MYTLRVYSLEKENTSAKQRIGIAYLDMWYGTPASEALPRQRHLHNRQTRQQCSSGSHV